ncbi:MAG: 50S ribosomal protein L21 [Desulfococcaceae bacterium]|jgi:large subunit ribosomal protein L21|nr:50S ribosomal protein L21 [Desulfococcaceae bacterium]
MYAVVSTGGKQYKVQKGDIFRVEKLPGNVGDSVSFDKVLLFSDGDNLRIGQPLLDDVSVMGQIVEQDRQKKIIVFKFKRRKRYRRKQGHRQAYTAVRIDSIGGGDAPVQEEEVGETAETAAERAE